MSLEWVKFNGNDNLFSKKDGMMFKISCEKNYTKPSFTSNVYISNNLIDWSLLETFSVDYNPNFGSMDTSVVIEAAKKFVEFVFDK